MHIDMTSVTIVAVLLVGGYVAKTQYDKHQTAEALAVEKERLREEAWLAEQAALRERKRTTLRETEELLRKEAAARAAAVREEQERKRQAAVEAEKERRARVERDAKELWELNSKTDEQIKKMWEGETEAKRAQYIAVSKEAYLRIVQDMKDTERKLLMLGSDPARSTVEKELRVLRERRDSIVEELRQGGVPPPDPTPQPKIAMSQPAAQPPPEGPQIVYVLKSGTRVAAVRSVEAEDVITVKTQAGKFVTINKTDIDRTEKP
ncbi:MAG TPA: hypothetical protein VGP72_21725 [Planctomycetota bacterium]